MIIPIIFIFLSCYEKANDNKEFSRENAKPRRESRISRTLFNLKKHIQVAIKSTRPDMTVFYARTVFHVSPDLSG